ncbi:MAG: ATP-binding protein, partial [Gammaproteobacteria bacterium]|nr:ATP-binding protein [Gammaproteobacteria bacterium]
YAHQFEVEQRLSSQLDENFEIFIDGMRIQQVLINLLTNAIKFSPPGGMVEINVQQQDDRVQVTVADQGPGIPEDRFNSIFDEFSQADELSTNRKIVASSGLGLSISKQLIEGHGGSIGCYNRGQGGALFYFTLPVTSS